MKLFGLICRPWESERGKTSWLTRYGDRWGQRKPGRHRVLSSGICLYHQQADKCVPCHISPSTYFRLCCGLMLNVAQLFLTVAYFYQLFLSVYWWELYIFSFQFSTWRKTESEHSYTSPKYFKAESSKYS